MAQGFTCNAYDTVCHAIQNGTPIRSAAMITDGRSLLRYFVIATCFVLFAAGEREQTVAILSAYHDALQTGQPDKVRQTIGTTFFMADERSAGGADRVHAHMFLTGKRLDEWPRNFLKEAGPYKNSFNVVSISERRDAAVVVTRDTGSNRVRSWKDEEVVWFLGRSDGQWRIVGMIIRDIQFPK